MAETTVTTNGKGNPWSYTPIFTPDQIAERNARQERDRAIRPLLIGHGGLLANGVRWWLDVPTNSEYDRNGDRLTVNFSDPRANGIMAYASRIEKAIENMGGIEEIYRDGLRDFTRLLSIRQLEPAEAGDPNGFFVKWHRRAS